MSSNDSQNEMQVYVEVPPTIKITKRLFDYIIQSKIRKHSELNKSETEKNQKLLQHHLKENAKKRKTDIENAKRHLNIRICKPSTEKNHWEQFIESSTKTSTTLDIQGIYRPHLLLPWEHYLLVDNPVKIANCTFVHEEGRGIFQCFFFLNGKKKKLI